jgi:hypothetical protein
VQDSVFYGSLEVEKGGSLLGHSGAMGDEPLADEARPPPLSRGADAGSDFGDGYDEGYDEGSVPPEAALGHAWLMLVVQTQGKATRSIPNALVLLSLVGVVLVLGGAFCLGWVAYDWV